MSFLKFNALRLDMTLIACYIGNRFLLGEHERVLSAIE